MGNFSLVILSTNVVLPLLMLSQHLHLLMPHLWLPFSSVFVVSFIVQLCFLKSLGTRESFKVLALLNTVIGCFGILSLRYGSPFSTSQYFCNMFLIVLWSLLYVVINKKSFLFLFLEGLGCMQTSCISWFALLRAPFMMEVVNFFSLNLSRRMFACVVKSQFLVQFCLIRLNCLNGTFCFPLFEMATLKL